MASRLSASMPCCYDCRPSSTTFSKVRIPVPDPPAAMCELFGASARQPRDYARWLSGFRQRGGATADNPDGWGLAWWKDGRARVEKAPEPGHRSERLAQLAAEIVGDLLLAHVRKATLPATPGQCNYGACHPDGETDSEFAFCHLLAGIVDAYAPDDPGHWLEQLSQRAGRPCRRTTP